jgi:hypothetical protein
MRLSPLSDPSIQNAFSIGRYHDGWDGHSVVRWTLCSLGQPELLVRSCYLHHAHLGIYKREPGPDPARYSLRIQCLQSDEQHICTE